MKTVYIYTDGSCLGNPGPGGYAAILKYGEHEKILAEGYQLTTNNRMEILAAIEALNALKLPCHVKLYSDSQYLRDGITKWMEKWKSNQWRTSNKKPVKNRDLWERLDQATEKHNIEWIWVKGHAGHHENEQCDLIAKQQAESPKQIDVEYEQDKELK